MAKNLVFPCRFIPRQMVLKGVLEKVESLVSLSSKPEFPFWGRYSSLFVQNLDL